MRACLLLLMLLGNGAFAQEDHGGASIGGFVVLPPLVESEALRGDAREMHDSGTLQTLAEVLNGLVVLPRDVGLRFAECEEANAFYDSEARRVELCLELMQGMAETLDGQFETEDQTAEALAGAFIAVVLHEVGHALVDVLEIPVTGREEDAVDQLSAWMLIEAGDVDSVLGAAASYYTDPDLAEEDFAGEHSLDRQRYFNLICWVYGSDPSSHADLIETWGLPQHRADQCEAEYAQLDRSWSRLLAGHLREDSHGIAMPSSADVATRETRNPSPSGEPATQPRPRDLTKPLGRITARYPAPPQHGQGSFRTSDDT